MKKLWMFVFLVWHSQLFKGGWDAQEFIENTLSKQTGIVDVKANNLGSDVIVIWAQESEPATKDNFDLPGAIK